MDEGGVRDERASSAPEEDPARRERGSPARSPWPWILVPELQHERDLRALVVQASLIALGIAVMTRLTLVD